MSSMSPDEGAKRHQRLLNATYRFVAHSWRPVFFAASIVHILESLGVLKLVTKFSILVVSSLAAQGPLHPVSIVAGTPVVILLGSDDFMSRYGERSPLDRCEMASDIERILKKSPTRMAVDFDLSPIYNPSDRDRICQTRLDKELAANASKLVVLAPFPASSEPLMLVKHEWMKKQCSLGIHFADGTLEQSMGMVTEHSVGQDAASLSRMAEQLHGEFSNLICDQIVRVQNASANRWVNVGWSPGAEDANLHEPVVVHEHDTEVASEVHGGHHGVPKPEPVNYRELAKSVAVIDIGSKQFAELPLIENSSVIFGGDWGRDDSFLTPIGTIAGVVIHAARLASLKNPVKPIHPILAFWADAVAALCFGWVIAKFWNAYVVAQRVDIQGNRTALGSLFMTTFIAVYLGLVIFFFLAAEYMFSFWGIAIAPLVISISMLVDGFVAGPVEKITELIHDESKGHVRGPGGVERNKQDMHQSLMQVAGAWIGLVVFGCLVYWVPGPTRELAAYVFALALGLLAVLLLVHFVNEFRQTVFSRQKLSVVTREIAAFLQPTRFDSSESISDSQIIKTLGFLAWLLKSVIFWGVLSWGGWILYSHSLH